MKFQVFRLYANGTKLRQPLPPVAGDLSLFKWGDGANLRYTMRAQLNADDGAGLLPVLVDVQVTRVSHEGMVLRGREILPRSKSIKARVDYAQQTWWCQIER